VLISIWGSAVALIVAYGCRFLDSVIDYALCGGTKSVDLPDPDPRSAITSLARWTLCFFTGPAFFVSLAIRYLAARSAFAFVDGLILAVLTTAAMTSWIIGRLVRAARRERDCPLPSSVLTALRALGWRAPLAGIGVTAAGFVHLLLAASAIVLLRQTWLAGVVLLWFCWYSAWQCATYSLWTIGIWHHRASRTGKIASRTA
jgi:DMSO reductase anchor subunit